MTGRNTTRTEELRFALVMNGGVSLAVWMGGVTTEIARAVRGSHPVYRDLLELTQTRARVDVICGTSAGGINGAALALALQCGTDVAQLRDVWQEKAAFADLLRSPSESDPPSLLDGNGYFLPTLQHAFKNLHGKGRLSSSSPIDLTLTATLLNAKPKLMTDDLGASVEDAEHRARFNFNGEHFKEESIVERLAFAARATASFPLAFEPVFCKADGSASKDDYKGVVDFDNSRFLIDGGVLDNKPFEAALEKLFQMPVSWRVRRVLAYIVPDPGITASPGPDDEELAPNLASVALASLFSIPSAETIGDQIDQIKAHNRRVRRYRTEVVGLMKILLDLRRRNVATTPVLQSLFPQYYRRRVDGAVDFILNEIELGARKGIGLRTRSWLKEIIFAHYSEAGIADQARWVPTAWPETGFAEGAEVEEWSWGLYTVEFLASVMLELLRRSERLLAILERDLGTEPPTERTSEPTISTECDFADPDIAAGDSEQPDRAPGALAPYWTRAAALIDTLVKQRSLNRKYWQGRADGLLRVLSTSAATDPDDVLSWLRESLIDPDRATAQREACKAYGKLALAIAQLILEVNIQLVRYHGALETMRVTAKARPEEHAGAADLSAMLAFLHGTSAEAVLDRLLQIDVAQYVLGERTGLSEDVALELVQISGGSSSPLGMGPSLSDKLAGLQLAHFGAFYKKSWRANDWMHGRMDGSERLVHILLNPERLHLLYAGCTPNGKKASEFVYDEIYRIAVPAAPSVQARAELQRFWKATEVRRELAFLDDPAARVPQTLDHSCAALTRRLHLGILHHELPNIVATAAADQTEGAVRTGVGAQLAAEFNSVPLSPSRFVDLWRNRSLGKEKIAQELGSDLMTRTLSQTIAVAHAACSSSKAGLGPLRLLIGGLQLPVKLFYLMTNQLLHDSKTAAAASVSLVTVGGLLVVLSMMVEKFPTSLSGFGWGVIAAGLATAIFRAPRGAVTVAVAAVVAALLLLPFSWKPAALAVSVAVVLIALWRYPALLGVSAVVGIAWWSIGDLGRMAARTWVCHTSPVSGRLGPLCWNAATELPKDPTQTLDHVRVVAVSVLAVLAVWVTWSVLPKLRSLERYLRRWA